MTQPSGYTNTFAGTSDAGDLTEALTVAIQAAKQEMRTDFVTWMLESVKGESGGFSDVNRLTVTIVAQGPK